MFLASGDSVIKEVSRDTVLKFKYLMKFGEEWDDQEMELNAPLKIPVLVEDGGI